MVKPHVPSDSRPTLRWNSRKARSVRTPKIPSGRPQSKPIRVSLSCRSCTSSPWMRWPGVKANTRSPRAQRASSRWRSVCGPTIPSTGIPRCCWNVRTACSTSWSNSTSSSDAVARSGSTSIKDRRTRRARMSATATPESPRRMTDTLDYWRKGWRSESSAALGLAPMIVFTTSPPE